MAAVAGSLPPLGLAGPAVAPLAGVRLAHGTAASSGAPVSWPSQGARGSLALPVACLAAVSLLARRVASRRTGRRGDWRNAVVALAAEAEGEGTKRRRRRRRRRPAGDLLADPVLAETLTDVIDKDAYVNPIKELTCDCEHILETVVEVDDAVTPEECDILIDAARRKASKIGWGAEAHAKYPTQDVKVKSLPPAAQSIFKARFVDPMRGFIAEHFDLPEAYINIADGFIVKYDEKGQTSLSMHRDGSIVSGIFSLSPGDEYEGGGTVFSDGAAFRPEQGGGILFAGQRRHGGLPILSGTRYICTLFFSCGELSCRECAVKQDEGERSMLEGAAMFFNPFAFGQ